MCSRRWSGTKRPRERQEYHKTCVFMPSWKSTLVRDDLEVNGQRSPQAAAGGAENQKQEQAGEPRLEEGLPHDIIWVREMLVKGRTGRSRKRTGHRKTMRCCVAGQSAGMQHGCGRVNLRPGNWRPLAYGWGQKGNVNAILPSILLGSLYDSRWPRAEIGCLFLDDILGGVRRTRRHRSRFPLSAASRVDDFPGMLQYCRPINPSSPTQR